MIKTVSVHGFQSIADAELDFGSLNVIVGSTGSGKSALIRAIKAVVTNRSGREFITHGATECDVLLETDDDHSVLWHKPRVGGASYIVDDQQLTKTGRSVPEQVEEALGIRSIDIEANYSVMPQIHMQFDPQFLLAESPGRVAKVLAKLTRLDVVIQAESSAAKDLKRVHGDLGQITVQILEAEATRSEIDDQIAIAAEEASLLEEVAAWVVPEADRVERAQTALVHLSKLVDEAPTEVIDIGVIRQARAWFDRLDRALLVVARLETAVDKIAAEKTVIAESRDVSASVRKELAKVKTCPVCGSPLKEGLA